MRSDRDIALIDACVLAGALTRNMVLSLAEAGFFRPRWSKDIIDETERAICKILQERGQSEAGRVAKRQCMAIVRAFPEAIVERYASIVPSLALPDPNDRHVLAAAVQTQASVVVTNNIKHFPKDYLSSLGLQVSTADDFLANLIDFDRPGALGAFRIMRQRFKRPNLDAETLLKPMEKARLTQTASLLIGDVALL
jgi:predicted nucleic acid-binding protein